MASSPTPSPTRHKLLSRSLPPSKDIVSPSLLWGRPFTEVGIHQAQAAASTSPEPMAIPVLPVASLTVCVGSAALFHLCGFTCFPNTFPAHEWCTLSVRCDPTPKARNGNLGCSRPQHYESRFPHHEKSVDIHRCHYLIHNPVLPLAMAS